VCAWIHYTIYLNCIFQVNFDTSSGEVLKYVDICYQKCVHAAIPRPRLYIPNNEETWRITNWATLIAGSCLLQVFPWQHNNFKFLIFFYKMATIVERLVLLNNKECHDTKNCSQNTYFEMYSSFTFPTTCGTTAVD
jgi:hypothetical protein